MIESSPPPSAELRLTARNPGTEIQVFDASLDRVARGFGSLEQQLAPGIYQIVYRTGSAREETLVALKAGRRHEAKDVGPEFIAPAPITGTLAASQTHQDALRWLTRPTNSLPDDRSKLLVFVRTLGDEHVTVRTAGLSVHDRDGQELASFVTAKGERGPGWAALSMELPEGGYALRTHAEEGASGSTFDQSLWVLAGWQHVLILPVQQGMVAPDFASLHVTSTDEAWPPVPAHSETALAIETMLAGLRQGSRSVSRQELSSSGQNNPMFSILAAHSLLAARTPDFELFDELVSQLRTRFPGHPDVLGLWAAGYERRHKSGSAHPHGPSVVDLGFQQLGWPPMMAAGYHSLLRIDAAMPQLNAIEPHSVAERAAVQSMRPGLWSAWQSLPAQTKHGQPELGVEAVARPYWLPSVSAQIDRASEMLRSLRNDAEDAYYDLTNADVAARHWKRMKGTLATDDLAFARVVRFLSEKVAISDARSLAEFLRQLDASEISLHTGVPVRVVGEVVAAARSANAEAREPLTVRAWLFFEDVQRYARALSVRRHLSGLDLASLARESAIAQSYLERVAAAILSELAPADEWTALLKRSADMLDAAPLKHARLLIERIDIPTVSAATGVPVDVIEALTRAVRRLLQALDDRATRRLRHKLTEFVEYASRTAAQELFAGLAIDRLSAETGLPFVQAHRAVSALMQSLPEAKRSDSERARDLKHEMMELPWAAAVREVLEALGRSPTLKRIGNRILRSWSRA